ncbi:hypothetical protein V495_05838 [Pseudogymnoascus sp. VKM F-4514 (FW-929)]|nr:hypothetical protein V495_05838 [Pseudogymnoascus sp. VKM F-4514 (FW-929)]KFY62392.1 hypothetical protein V497_02384 [Pseudogymnoascus sp. VKM F-4516 (FW-969)]
MCAKAPFRANLSSVRHGSNQLIGSSYATAVEGVQTWPRNGRTGLVQYGACAAPPGQSRILRKATLAQVQGPARAE